jgi:hypothetical protein
LQALPGSLVKLAHFKFFAPERVHHPDGTQSFLRLRQDSAFLFLNSRRFATDPMRENVNRAHNQRHHTE